MNKHAYCNVLIFISPLFAVLNNMNTGMIASVQDMAGEKAQY